MASTTPMWHRIVTFVLAALFIASSVGIVVYYVLNDKQQRDQQAAINQALQSQQTNTQGDSMSQRGLDNFTPIAKIDTLKAEDLVTGTGKTVSASDTVTVDYIGVLAVNGQGFDNSYDRGQPATFALSSVIQGWQQGLVGMQEGGTRRLYIPAELAYGAASPSPDIPANSDLVFDVKLIKVGE